METECRYFIVQIQIGDAWYAIFAASRRAEADDFCEQFTALRQYPAALPVSARRIIECVTQEEVIWAA